MAYPPIAPSPAPQQMSAPPTSTSSRQPPKDCEMSSDEMKQWWSRIELARRRRTIESTHWKQLYKRFLPPTTTDPDSLHSNIHFRNVETKKAEVFARLPELQLTPLEPLNHVVDPQTQQPVVAEEIVAIKRAVLNKLLGRDHANVKHMMDVALFDIFLTSGIGATKICYEADVQPTPMEMAGPDVPIPGAVLNLHGAASTTMTITPVVVHERWRWYAFSALKFLQPHDWHSTEYDEAPWLGMEGVIEPARVPAEWKLPEGFSPTATRDALVLGADTDPVAGSSSLVEFVEIWLHAAHFDPAIAHSQLFRQLILVKGLDRPAQYRESPYQSQDDHGRLTPDSMIGNPIHPITLRTMSDSAWPRSDAAFTDPLVRLEDQWIAQQVKLREANIARFLHSDAITDAIDKLKEADTGQGVAIDGMLLAQGIEKLVVPLPHLENSQSDVQGYQLIRRAMDETLGVGSNQAGNFNRSTRSATEVATVQANVSVRLQGERNACIEAFLRGVRKFDALVQRYADQALYVEIVGADGARRLAQASPQILNGRYAYDILPDSQLSVDAAQRRKLDLDYVNFMAKSPFMNQKELARTITLDFGKDPTHLVHDPAQPPPEKPSMSFTFHGSDLEIPEVRAVLAAAGIQLPPQASPELLAAAASAAAKAQPHGGPADRMETLSQHHGELTGALPGRGPVPPVASVPATATTPPDSRDILRPQ